LETTSASALSEKRKRKLHPFPSRYQPPGHITVFIDLTSFL